MRGANHGAAVLGAALVAASVVACSSERRIPDPSDPVVRAEEQRLGTLVAASRPWGLDGWDCRVRLLRQQAPTSWTWTLCRRPSGGEGFVAPVRVDADVVWMPLDDARREADIRARFPEDLVGPLLSDSYPLPTG